MPRKTKKRGKTTSKRKTTTPTKAKSSSNIDRILAENLISLQKVLINLSVKLDDMTKKMTHLLDLFETSAKTLAKKDFEFIKEGKRERESLEKLNTLLEQNKILARGLTLMHEKAPVQQTIIPMPRPMAQQQIQQPQPMQQRPQQEQLPKMTQENGQQTSQQSMETGNYQKSISTQQPQETPTQEEKRFKPLKRE